MKKIDVILYIHEGYNGPFVTTIDMTDSGYALLGIESVEVTIPDVDVKKAKIIALKTELAKELSETEQHKSRIAKIEAELKKLEG